MTFNGSWGWQPTPPEDWRSVRGVLDMLRTMGAYEARGGLLVSYLLFDKSYTCELMAMGHADAQAQRAEIVPYLAPWVT
mgnify:CR=1 FL=1